MSDLERENRVREIRGARSISKQLERLGYFWENYREKGSGKALGVKEAEVVYMLARYFTVSRGWSLGSDGLSQDEVKGIVGFDSNECYSRLEQLNLSGPERAGLYVRVDYLIDIAKGRKQIPRENELTRMIHAIEFRGQGETVMPQGRLVAQGDLKRDTRFIERGWEEVRQPE